MATFDGNLKQTFSTSLSADAARARFLDREHIVGTTLKLERHDFPGEGQVHFVLEKQVQGPYSFQPDYVVEYVADGDAVRWKTLRGNLQNEGRATFRSTGSGCDVTVDQTITVELPIPRLAVRVVRPVVDRMMRPDMRAWIEAMLKP